jgi:hypothetical protein
VLLLSVTCCLLSSNAFAAYASRNLFIPIFGRGVGGDGRHYETAFTLTNTSSKPADVTLTFLEGGRPHPKPHGIVLRVDAGETRTFDPAAADVMGQAGGFGAMHIESKADVLAHARLYTYAPGDTNARSVASSFNAIPAQFAAGTGDTAMLQGVDEADGFRSKLYVVETAGQPLTFALSLLDAHGVVIDTQHDYLSGFEQNTYDLAELFRGAHGQSVLRVKGVSGNGRVIIAGVRIATATQDGTAFEMSFVTAPRWRLPAGEVAAYVAAGAALIAAIVFGRRSG